MRGEAAVRVAGLDVLEPPGHSCRGLLRPDPCPDALTGGSRENWPRTILEAWASGVVPIVDADFGVREMVTHGVDGFHARSTDEAAFLASLLAFDHNLRENLVRGGYETLTREHFNAERSARPFLNPFDELARV